MEIYNLENDIKIFCVTAKPFPNGIMNAWQKWQAIILSDEGRHFFGSLFPKSL
jgi:hypothetical protein